MPPAARNPVPLHTHVLDVVSRWDPEGLLAIGAPGDEYDPEAGSFAALLGRGVTITPEIVEQVWEKWFGPGSGFVRGASRAELAKFADELNQAVGTAKGSAQA